MRSRCFPRRVSLAKGSSLQLVIRNQDDVLSRLGTWGVYMLPFMQTVTHEIHFGESHLLIPYIPAEPNRGSNVKEEPLKTALGGLSMRIES